MKRALVTGGAGFIGSHVVRRLVARNVPVRVLELESADLSNLEGLDIEVRHGDIRDKDSLARYMKGCDTLFHVAANPNLWARDNYDFHEVNTLGTERTLAAASAAGVERVVYTSTESILTLGPHRGSITEDVEPQLEDMVGAYTRSKYLAERSAREWAKRGLSVVIVNPTMPVGPGDVNLSPPGRLLVDVLKRKLPAYLDCMLNVVDVRDVAEGHVLAAEQGATGQRYILGGENVQLGSWLRTVAKEGAVEAPKLALPLLLAYPVAAVSGVWAWMTKRPPRVTLAGLALAKRMRPFDSTRAKDELGYEVRSVEESTRDAVTWFKEKGYA